MQKIVYLALPLLIAALATYLIMGQANQCGDLCDRDFWKYSKAQDVKELIDAGADVNGADKDELRPIYRAARQGDAQSLTLLIEAGALVNFAIGERTQPLHEAIGGPYEQKPQNVRTLLDAGAIVDARSPSGSTALHTAAGNPSAQIVLMLIEAGADVNSPNLGEGAYKNDTPLHAAIWSGGVDNIAVLVNNGADINARNAAGETPLHVAANAGSVEKIDVLLSLGADGTIRDAKNNTPYDLFTSNENRAGSPMQFTLQQAANPHSEN